MLTLGGGGSGVISTEQASRNNCLSAFIALSFFTPNKKISIEDANDRGEQRIPSERDPDHRDGDCFVVVEQNTQIEKKGFSME